MMTQLTFPETRSLKPQTPRALLEAALEWIDTNQGAWGEIVGMATIDAQTRGRVRIKRYIEDLRDDRRVQATPGAVVKLPNAYSAPFGRILAAWYPSLAEAIPMQHSKVDGCAVPPCPDWARQA